MSLKRFLQNLLDQQHIDRELPKVREEKRDLVETLFEPTEGNMINYLV